VLLENILYENIEKLILQGFVCFYAGGARGFDTLAAKTVLKLKEKYCYIQLMLVLPFYNQFEKEKNWSPKEIEEYDRLKRQAYEVIHIQQDYSSGCYYKRNRFLVDFSSVCLCYRYKNYGGTAYTVKYAKSKYLKIINLNELL